MLHKLLALFRGPIGLVGGRDVESNNMLRAKQPKGHTAADPRLFESCDDDKQFKKWQWITARVAKASNDHRQESHKLFVDTIICDALTRRKGTGNRRISRPFSSMPATHDVSTCLPLGEG
jgi:hypothetical protein